LLIGQTYTGLNPSNGIREKQEVDATQAEHTKMERRQRSFATEHWERTALGGKNGTRSQNQRLRTTATNPAAYRA
jgi:chitodextrinase